MIAPSIATSRTGSTSAAPAFGSKVSASPPWPSASAISARNRAANSSENA
jgi:hypothetical protein